MHKQKKIKYHLFLKGIFITTLGHKRNIPDDDERHGLIKGRFDKQNERM